MPAQPAGYLTRHLTPETWDDFAGLVEENNGVWGGCWCMGFHPEGLARTSPGDNHVASPAAYQRALVELPDWRVGCVFTGKGHRGQGVARAAVSAVLDAIREAGGGLVEAYPEQVEGREPQRGAYFHTGPESLFVELGFARDRQIAKWRWVMRLQL
jgi:GNAT superfamily N-acetyltransferase